MTEARGRCCARARSRGTGSPAASTVSLVEAGCLQCRLERRVHLDANRLSVLEVPDEDDVLGGLDAGGPSTSAQGDRNDHALTDWNEVRRLEGHAVHRLIEGLEVAPDALRPAIGVRLRRERRRRRRLEIRMYERQQGL